GSGQPRQSEALAVRVGLHRSSQAQAALPPTGRDQECNHHREAGYLPPGVDWPDQEGLPVQCHRELHISAATLDLDADPVSHPPPGGLAELVSDRHALLCSDDGPVQLAHQEQRSSEVEECKRENALSAARPSLASEAHRAFATFHTGLCV